MLRAWRERWNECQWGLNIKKVRVQTQSYLQWHFNDRPLQILPRGVSGDAYNLADCILEQAVIGGSGANQVILSYLRHSLCSHLISYAAVLKWISNYDKEHHSHLLLALLEFIDSIIPAVTCNNRQEENLILEATNGLVRWLWNVYNRPCQSEEDDSRIKRKVANVLEKICGNEFLLGILCLAKVDNPGPMADVAEGLSVRNQAIGSKAAAVELKIESHFQMLLDLQVDKLDIMRIERRSSPAITYILQPLLVVELLNNPSNDTRIISQLLLVQKLKRFSRSEFYCQILRSCLLTLQNVIGTSRGALWCAFTFIKIPQILLKLDLDRSGRDMASDTHPDLLQAIDLLLEETSLLDILDFKCSLNTLECLMKEFQKHKLVTEKHTEHYAAKRESISTNVQKLDTTNQTPSIVKFVTRAEQPLSGILKTLSMDYNKVQEALPGLLFQILHGNSLELILSVATVEGKLKTFVNRLIKCNECSKQVPGETGKPAATRALIFDVTFLYLAYIVQTCGAAVILEENGDSFFETWVRNTMVDRRKPKSPMTIVRACDQAKVDELLLILNGTSQSGGANTNLKWHEIAETTPGMLYQVILAWENGISTNEVKVILENLKAKMGVYSVCAASWLCSYMYAINEDEHHKPLNMIQQLLAGDEEMTPVAENLKERLSLTNKIIRRMQAEFQSRGTRVGGSDLSVMSSNPLEESFNEAWKEIQDRKWLPVDVGQKLQSLYESCGSFWLVQRLVQELDNCKYVTEIDQVTDLVFAIMHLDIESTTVAFISELLPVLMMSELPHPYTTAVARLCVYVILSAVEKSQLETMAKKKRTRLETPEEQPTMKMRKLDADVPMDTATGKEHLTGGAAAASNITVREPLCSMIKEMFKLFAQYVASDEYSPRVNFIFEFITVLVECGKLDSVPVLRLIPPGFLQNLLKILPLANIKPGLVLQLYDLSLSSGRQAALSDLCVLRRNIQINLECIKL